MNTQNSGPAPGSPPTEERVYSQHVVDLFQDFADGQAKQLRTAGDTQVAELRARIAELEQQVRDVEAQTERKVAELHRAAGEIVRRALPQPTFAEYLPQGKRHYPDGLDGPELSSDPDGALARLDAAHAEQDAAEQVQR
ncbi:hypothetical protein [Acrocarpospora sp. B8E8]|uniref:hypothetical protein n=1 Tax=Acrocarpospora sp. B8E8 TaxID=3153572 RepID=UPI00325C40E8